MILNRSISKFIQRQGITCTFELEGEAPFTARIGPRIRREEDLTAGIDQHIGQIVVSMDSWKTRAPKKGDRAIFSGRRHAIMGAHQVDLGDGTLGYKIRIKG